MTTSGTAAGPAPRRRSAPRSRGGTRGVDDRVVVGAQAREQRRVARGVERVGRALAVRSPEPLELRLGEVEAVHAERAGRCPGRARRRSARASVDLPLPGAPAIPSTRRPPAPASARARATSSASGGDVSRAPRPRAPTAAAGRRRARAHVRAATRQANSVAATAESMCRARSRPSPRACHQATKPPPNASPAPIVSTTFVRGDGTATSAVRVITSAPLGPRVSSPTDGPVGEQVAHGVHGAAARGQPVEVLLADLQHVAVREHARAAARGRPSGSGMMSGRMFGSMKHHRVAGELARSPPPARAADRLDHQPERAGVDDRAPRRDAPRAPPRA